MHDSIEPLVEALADVASSAGPPSENSPRWLQWGCAALMVTIFFGIVIALIWAR